MGSRGSTRSTAATSIAGDRGAAAEVRRDGVLSDDGRVRSGRAARGAAERRAASIAQRLPAAGCARAAGASRKQLHQSRVSRRAARRVPAEPAGCVRCAGAMGATGAMRCGRFRRPRHPRGDRRAGASVGIVTLAPELDGALDLIRHLVSQRPPCVARPLGRDAGAGARGDRRGRAARDAPVQSDASARSSRARPRRRDSDERRRLPPKSSATACTCIATWCGWRSPPKARRG